MSITGNDNCITRDELLGVGRLILGMLGFHYAWRLQGVRSSPAFVCFFSEQGRARHCTHIWGNLAFDIHSFCRRLGDLLDGIMMCPNDFQIIDDLWPDYLRFRRGKGHRAVVPCDELNDTMESCFQ